MIIDIPVPNPQKGFEIIIKDNEGNLYQGLLAEPLKENVKEMQGKDIKLIKIEHTK